MANLWQNITGTVKTAFKIGKTNTATIDASGLTASRAQALPDKAGTLVIQLASGKIDGITGGTATGEALTFDSIGVSVQAYDADLAAVAGLSSSGLIARTGAGTAAARTITGTASQVVVTNGDGVSGNPTLSTPQDIHAGAIPAFRGQVLTETTAGVFPFQVNGSAAGTNITNVMGPIVANTNAAASSWAGILFSDASGAGAASALMGVQLTDRTNHYGRYGFGTRAADGFSQRAGIDALGVCVGAFISHGGTHTLAFAGGTTSPTQPSATADCVTISSVDNGAGNREVVIQPESGGPIAYGADVLRRVPTANRNVDDRIKAVTTTDATVTTVDTIAITAGSTYLIQTRIVGRRTGGVSGTADDGCSYVRRGTYTTKAGTVTLMGAVETIGTDREDQAGFDATMTISSTNVLVRVTGAASNNMSWQAHTIIQRIAS